MNALILGFDVKGYSSIEDNHEKKELRQYLYKLVTTSNVYKVDNTIDDLLDTGDGFYLVLNETDYGKVFNLLRSFISIAKTNSKWQIRATMHVGSVEDDDSFGGKSGKIGTGIDYCCRYLDNQYLKEAINKNSEEKFIFGISDKIIENSKNETWIDLNDFEKFDFTVKTYSGSFYLYKENVKNIPVQIVEMSSKNLTVISDDFQEELCQSDFKYKNKYDEESNLNTFFIYPELSVISDEEEKETKIKSNELLDSFIESPFNIHFFGEEQCGKSSLAKVYFHELVKTGLYIPVLIQFKLHEKGFLRNKINDYLKKEYASYDTSLPLVLILDDFFLLEDYIQEKIITEIKNMSNTYSIIITDKVYRESVEHLNRLKEFKSYSIRLLGHLKRMELVDKWLSFNNIAVENYKSTDELLSHVDQTLMHGVIPYTPFYILTILAAKENATPLDTEITSKGYCYQALINIGLNQMGIVDSSTISSITNFFGFVAFNMFETRRTDYDEDELEKIFLLFDNKFNCTYEFEDLIKMLAKSSIFTKNSLNLYSFNGVYFYYYFVARYIAARLTDNKYYSLTKNMIEKLYEKENGYIVIFIIHHTRNIVLFDEIQLNAMLAYENTPKAIIDKEETVKIDESLKDIKQMVIEGADNSRQNRIKQAEKEDILQEQNEKKDIPSETSEVEPTTNHEINTELQELRKTLKTIEVLGQILKNHNGEIDKTKLIECFTNGIESIRRVCRYLIDQVTECEDDLVSFIVQGVEKNKEEQLQTKADIENYAHKVISGINLSIIYDSIRLAGNLLGSKDLIKIVRTMYNNDKCPINFCIYMYCSLWHNKQPPINELKDNFNDFPLAVQTIIRVIIKNYFDVHKIDIKDKQKIADIIGVKVNKLKIDYSK